jgi:HSP20 family protein
MMTLSKWQPFRELSSIRKQMDRLFEDMLSTGDNNWMGLHNIRGMWTPAVEIKEQEKELILKAEIPGIDVKDLEVQVSEDRVTISGEHEEEKSTEDKDKNYFHSEFRYGKFARVIPLSMPIKTDEIKSDFKKGVLTLTLPKIEDSPKKSVKVELSAS